MRNENDPFGLLDYDFFGIEPTPYGRKEKDTKEGAEQMTEQEKNTIIFESSLMANEILEAKKERSNIERHARYFVNGGVMMFENYTELQRSTKEFDQHISAAESALKSIRAVLERADKATESAE